MNDYSKITALYSRLSMGTRTGTAARATAYRTRRSLQSLPRQKPRTATGIQPYQSAAIPGEKKGASRHVRTVKPNSQQAERDLPVS